MIARLVRRVSIYRRLRLDDCFLIFSSAALAAATGFLYYHLPTIFLVDELASDLQESRKSRLTEADQDQFSNTIQVVAWIYLFLSFTAIFSVKFGFLSFFWHIVNRITPLETLCKGASVSIALAFVCSMVAIPFSYPKRSVDLCKLFTDS